MRKSRVIFMFEGKEYPVDCAFRQINGRLFLTKKTRYKVYTAVGKGLLGTPTSELTTAESNFISAYLEWVESLDTVVQLEYILEDDLINIPIGGDDKDES